MSTRIFSRPNGNPRARLGILCGLLLAALTAALVTEAQRRGRGGRGGWRGEWRGDRGDYRPVPEWQTDKEVPGDVFTFVRLEYNSWDRQQWAVDYPDSDLNFSYRLQQLTALEVDPDGKIVRLTDPELYDYPFVYMVEPGRIDLTDEEETHLRRYLLNGGFLMVDDFWGYYEWDNFYRQIKEVFPEREPVELDISHPIFRAVFDLKEKPQVPALGVALYMKEEGISYEPNKPGSEEVHFKALFDDDGRMMAIICHNTDLGDGWEREGENEWYFREYSEKKAFPMGINIVFYAMTH